MDNNRVYLSFGRHGRYGINTAIEHTSMLEAYLGGVELRKTLPKCDAVYYSPIPRAAMTAKFRGLGLGCNHLLEKRELEEDMSTFVIRSFISNILQNSEENERHYHFVTHQPVLEKLGLPDLETCGICLCVADSWQEMLADNFEVVKLPNQGGEKIHKLLNDLRIEADELENFSPNGVYSALSRL